jgi:hypothetical protein
MTVVQLGPGGLTRWAPRKWLHLEEWTSPAALARADTYIEGEAACEDLGYVITKLSMMADQRPAWLRQAEPAQRAVTRGMVALEDVRAILHAELIRLRDANRPFPRAVRRVPLIDEAPPHCGEITKALTGCRRRTRGFRRCWQHRT